MDIFYRQVIKMAKKIRAMKSDPVTLNVGVKDEIISYLMVGKQEECIKAFTTRDFDPETDLNDDEKQALKKVVQEWIEKVPEKVRKYCIYRCKGKQAQLCNILVDSRDKTDEKLCEKMNDFKRLFSQAIEKLVETFKAEKTEQLQNQLNKEIDKWRI